MPRYIVRIEEPTEPSYEPVRPGEKTPEIEAGVWFVGEPDIGAAIAAAKHLHRASYGRMPEAATITVEKDVGANFSQP